MSSLFVNNIVRTRMISLPILSSKRTSQGSMIDRLEEDRLRIAQELHDDLGQRLALFEIQLAQLEDKCPHPETVKGLRSLRDRVGEMDRDIHRICCQLYPVVLEQCGLVVALRSLCRDFSQFGICAEFANEDRPPTISRSVSLCLYRVVQEALNNILKHARTNYAKVSLRVSRGRLEVAVEDAGVGFDPSIVKGTSGLGLASIEERVKRAGGRCFIRSTPGVGTEVKVCVIYPCRVILGSSDLNT
jgi:signal transduction histidine kinase